MPSALTAARALNQKIAEEGVYVPEMRKLTEGVLRVQTAWLSEAILCALDYYIKDGGGSRGARMFCSKNGVEKPDARVEKLDVYRFVPEKSEHRHEKILLRYCPETGIEVFKRPIKGIEDTGKIYFEKNWGAFLTGAIYESI